MICKEHLQDGRLVLAICDSDLLGKKIEEGNRQLDLSSSFYKGEEATSQDLSSRIKKAYLVNVAGEKSIAWLKEQVNIGQEIPTIGGVPHLQVLLGTFSQTSD